MPNITLQELEKLSHLKIDSSDLADRVIPLFASYKNENWEQFVSTEKGLMKISIVNIVDGFYFSKEAVKKDDLKLQFFNIMLKKANFKEKSKHILYILNDIQNLSASVEKINIFSTMHDKIDSYVLGKYVSTELEYMFKVCRSIYDLLQELITVVWNRFEYIDKSQVKKEFCKNCKTSFNSVIVVNHQPLTIEELIKRHNIPHELASFYFNQGEFFTWLRTYRDKISHSGQSFNIYTGEEGFSLSIKDNHFSKLHFWDDKNTLENGLGSVKSLTAYMVLNTISGLEEFAKSIDSIMKLPDDIAPEYDIYLRSKFNKTLQELHTNIDSRAWNNHKDNNI